MTRQRLFSTLLFLTSMLYVHAQFADPREKFSITADVDGATNTDYYWKSDKGERLEEGRLKHGVAARVRANLKVLGNRQSQNSASHQNSGRRYVEQRTNGRKFLLFVREHKVDEYGFTSPYYCLGLVDYVKSHGDKPMTITWAMQNHIPGFILDKAQKMAVG